VLPGIIGVVQATEAVKLLLGIGEPLIGRLLTYDALGMRFREVKLRRDPKCPLCGDHPTIRDLSIHREGGTAVCAVDGDGHPEPVAVSAAKAGG
jgi:adenylyltransferase/sulfurtransferase